jgi:hypothetical protein
VAGILLLIVFVGLFAIAGIMGAPYVPILKRDSTALLELSGLTKGQTLVDLGSGDGRLLRAAASHGIRGIGYEINPVMYLISLLVCFRYRKLVSLHLANLWQIRLPDADVIYFFLMPKFMARLDKKLSRELAHKTVVISYAFQLPNRKPIRQTMNTFVYDIGPS